MQVRQAGAIKADEAAIKAYSRRKTVVKEGSAGPFESCSNLVKEERQRAKGRGCRAGFPKSFYKLMKVRRGRLGDEAGRGNV